MQRWTSVLLGFVFAVALVALALKVGAPAREAAHAAPSASAAAEPPPTVEEPQTEDAGPEISLDTETDVVDEGDAGASALPASAPKDVHIGVILFTYAGAQFAPDSARSKEEAKKLAEATLEEAKDDFAKAVKKGDRGSTKDIGVVPRGVLEPKLEYAVFTLAKGKVYPEPLDTPRGYWVVIRNE
ncbi:MAG: peptidylprolyl isomerase [Myxococcales bacterium]|nr:peptidylprolyl isomerase [Myxococcales bacterium]MCB9577940.1 peptidylprolyl isomerase [Polyangiaceae bacterium]